MCCGFIVCSCPIHQVSDWVLSPGGGNIPWPMCSGEGTVFSERTVQGVVVVFEVLQLQEVPGPLAPLLHCWGVVVALGGGGRGGGAGGLRDAGQVFGRRLVALAWRAAVARLDAENNGGRVQAGNTAQLTFQDGISINGKLWRMKQSSLTHWPVQLELGGTSKILLHQKPADRTGANTHTLHFRASNDSHSEC